VPLAGAFDDPLDREHALGFDHIDTCMAVPSTSHDKERLHLDPAREGISGKHVMVPLSSTSFTYRDWLT
jgi:hypothetical protein